MQDVQKDWINRTAFKPVHCYASSAGEATRPPTRAGTRDSYVDEGCPIHSVSALDRAMVEILNVDPLAVPTVAASMKSGLCSNLEAINFPQLRPEDLKVLDWKLPDALMPIDFGLPRLMRSTFNHVYIRFIKEPISAYAINR